MSDSDRPTSDGTPRDTVEATTPVGWDEDEHGDDREEMLPPPPATERSRR